MARTLSRYPTGHDVGLSRDSSENLTVPSKKNLVRCRFRHSQHADRLLAVLLKARALTLRT
jgi:hypothetical protein